MRTHKSLGNSPKQTERKEMTMKIANNELENCNSIGQVVELINDEMSTDASAEMVAAKYALDGAKESGYNDNASIEAQLDSLVEAGAEFDFRKALEMAIAEKR